MSEDPDKKPFVGIRVEDNDEDNWRTYLHECNAELAAKRMANPEANPVREELSEESKEMLWRLWGREGEERPETVE